MPLSKKTKIIGSGIGIFIALIILIIGILFITGTITYQITNAVFGWGLVIIAAWIILEPLGLWLLDFF